MEQRSYLCIDLKSFYASVECVERGLDPMEAKLVVADEERSDKTICLAVSPALRALGVKNRCRLFEIPAGLDYIIAPPRMQKYLDYAAEIYGIYLEYLSKDDIYPYSVDEMFLDVTHYLRSYQCTARAFAELLMGEIQRRLGLRSAAGIGTNLYLCKIALDITAKHAPDFIGELDERRFRETLWDHRPLTDFWRIGPGTARRLEQLGITSMRQICEADEDMLYRVFGVDAELMIDHAHGIEPTTIADIKAYRPRSRCLTSGQVLMRDYSYEEGRVIVREMMDALCLDLVEQGLVTAAIGLTAGYSNALHCPAAKGTARLSAPSSADCVLLPAVMELYERIIDPSKPIRRFQLSCNELQAEETAQLSLFSAAPEALERAHSVQKAVLGIRKKYGKNSILKGTSYAPCATARERNHQIGGHKSGE